MTGLNPFTGVFHIKVVLLESFSSFNNTKKNTKVIPKKKKKQCMESDYLKPYK